MTPVAGARRWWRLSVLFGLATIAFAVWFTRVVPATGCLSPPRRGVTALLAYQMARTPADIETVFGREGDACRAGMVAALDRANLVDLVGFIATYGLFLACFLVAMSRDGGGRVARAGLFMLVAGLGFDALETATQLRITRELPGNDATLMALAIGCAGKWTVLSIVSVCAGLAMMARGGVVGRLAGVGCIAGAALVVYGLTDARAIGLLPLGSALAWTIMLLYAVVAALARADRAAPPR